jgi:hypothetical protein
MPLQDEPHTAELSSSSSDQPILDFPSLSLSQPEPPSTSDTSTHEPSTSDSEQDDDEDDGEGEDTAPLPYFNVVATAPPQLGSLSLPSPIFGRSFVDLLATPAPPITPSHTGTGTRPPNRARTPSTPGRSSISGGLERGHLVREPTLNFSVPRAIADQRVRRVGREEDVFVAAFPDVEVQVGEEEPASWAEEEWSEVAAFLAERGYRVELKGGEDGVSRTLR